MNLPMVRDIGMSKAEIAMLLSFIASFDQRTLGEADVEAWYLIAGPGRWRLDYARRAVIEFVTEATEGRVLPGHITKRIRARREFFAATYAHQPCPPDVVGVEAEVEWERRRLAAHIDAGMDAWANGDVR